MTTNHKEVASGSVAKNISKGSGFTDVQDLYLYVFFI